MSTLETILSRMMNEPAFANAIFADTGNALAEYNLTADEFAHFKGMSQADFEAFTVTSPEERKSLAASLDVSDYGTWQTRFGSRI